MGIPSSNVGERHLEPDVCLDELRDLPEPHSELRVWIARVVLRQILLRVCRLENLDRFEHLSTRGVHHISRARSVQRFQAIGRRTGGAHAELIEGVHRHRRRRSFEHPRCLLCHGDGAKGRCLRVVRTSGLAGPFECEIAVEPPVARAFLVGRARFHVVLRVEVRACRARTSHRMNGRENALIPELLHGSKRRMQTEKSVEVDHTCDA